jgi:hypothetical protein
LDTWENERSYLNILIYSITVAFAILNEEYDTTEMRNDLSCIDEGSKKNRVLFLIFKESD